jgi:hypothetical protein
MGEGQVSAVQQLARGPLLERDREVAALDELIAAAAGGEGWFAVLEAVAGMGKTRLVAETRRRAEEAGLRVLRLAAASWSVSSRSRVHGLARHDGGDREGRRS